MVKILLVGCGYWGKNWYNTIKSSKYELVGVVDFNPVIQVDTPLFKNINEVNIEYTHAIIATNAESHHKLKNELKCSEKNILIEKPCGVLDTRNNLINCFPGYIFLSSPQFKYIKSILNKKELGNILYSRFERASMGPRIRTDVSIVEDYAIHDLYLYQALFEYDDITILNQTLINSFDSHIQSDTLFLTIQHQNHYSTFFSSWRHPLKTRKIEIIGEKGSIVWEDDKVILSLSHYEKIDGYDSFRNDGYNLIMETPFEIELKTNPSNLHLQLEDFIENIDRSKIFKNTNNIIYKLNHGK